VGQEYTVYHVHVAVGMIDGDMLQNKQVIHSKSQQCINTDGGCLNTYCNYIYAFNLFYLCVSMITCVKVTEGLGTRKSYATFLQMPRPIDSLATQ
jgi:hypothetical protein